MPSVGAETVEFRDWVFLSVFGVLAASVKEVRSISLSWKQPSNTIAWVASKEVGICSRERKGELGFEVSELQMVGNDFCVGQTSHMRFEKSLEATEN